MKANHDITPGEILLEEWMKPRRLSLDELAIESGIPADALREIVAGRRAIDRDIALPLGTFFKTGAQFWLNLQSAYLERSR